MTRIVSRVFGLALLGTLAAGAASAQAPDPTGFSQPLNQAMATMESKLNLTAEQKPKADAIMQDAVSQRLVVLSQYGVKRGQRPPFSALLAIRSKMNAIASEAHAKMAHVLTPAQMQIYATQSEQSSEQIKSMLLGQ